jgi:hypothetical protein
MPLDTRPCGLLNWEHGSLPHLLAAVSDSESADAFAELTDLSTLTPLARGLVLAAFAERLGEEVPALDFHRHWNGGWRCRASLAGRGTLDFILLRTAAGTLLCMPVPMPQGWRSRGVADSNGTRWTLAASGMIERSSR